MDGRRHSAARRRRARRAVVGRCHRLRPLPGSGGSRTRPTERARCAAHEAPRRNRQEEERCRRSGDRKQGQASPARKRLDHGRIGRPQESIGAPLPSPAHRAGHGDPRRTERVPHPRDRRRWKTPSRHDRSHGEGRRGHPAILQTVRPGEEPRRQRPQAPRRHVVDRQGRVGRVPARVRGRCQDGTPLRPHRESADARTGLHDLSDDRQADVSPRRGDLLPLAHAGSRQIPPAEAGDDPAVRNPRPVGPGARRVADHRTRQARDPEPVGATRARHRAGRPADPRRRHRRFRPHPGSRGRRVHAESLGRLRTRRRPRGRREAAGHPQVPRQQVHSGSPFEEARIRRQILRPRRCRRCQVRPQRSSATTRRSRPHRRSDGRWPTR